MLGISIKLWIFYTCISVKEPSGLELGEVSFRLLALGELGEASLRLSEFGELGKVSFRLSELGELGEASFRILELGELGETRASGCWSWVS